MKKYILYILIIFLVIIIAGLILCLPKKNEQINPIIENKTLEPMQIVAVEESTLDEYVVEVLQIGGIGSRINQITAYNLEDEYLKPSEDWASVSFNRPAYKMDVRCRDGYYVSSCSVNGVYVLVDVEYNACEAILEEQIKNKVIIKCVQE